VEGAAEETGWGGVREMRRTAALASAVVVAALLVASCGSEPRGAPSPTTTSSTRTWTPDPCQPGPSEDVIFRGETLRDWVSFADWVLVVTVTSEKKRAFQPDGPASTPDESGFQGRDVTLRVDRTLMRTGDRPSPTTFTFSTAGWQFDTQGRRQPLEEHPCRPVLTVGERYVMPVSKVRPGLAPVGIFHTIPLNTASYRPATPATRALAGKSPEEMARILARTRPYPAAAAHPELPARERQSRALQAEEPATG
jgi:hypothetical protein